MASYGHSWTTPQVAFVVVEFLPIFVFGVIILAPDMLANQSKALKPWMIA